MSRDLVITAGSGTELTLTNSDYSMLLRAWDALRATVEPDIYRLSVRAGSSSSDYDLVINDRAARILPARVEAQASATLDVSSDGGEPTPAPTVSTDGATIRIAVAPPRFTAAAPLNDTGRSREYQSSFVAEASERHSYALGRGGSILLVARTWRRDPSRPLIDPAAGLTIHDAKGAEIADLSKGGERSTQGDDPAVVCRLDVDPGWYRLRMARQGMPVVEQAVVVSRTWQTQVFLLRQAGVAGSHDRLKMSMHVRALRGGRMFEPSDEDQRRIELAIEGLQRGRPVVSRRQLHDMLMQKQFDPMLGLLAGHQLDDSDPALLREVVQNLRRLLPDHPDVEALALRVPELSRGARFPLPPMLTRSWQQIVSRSASEPDTVPAGSLSEQVATRLYGVGAWLWWEAAERKATWSPKNSPRPSGLESTGGSALTKLIKRGFPTNAKAASQQALQLQSMLSASDYANVDTAPIEQQVIRALGVPRSLVERTAQELLDATGTVATKAKNVVVKKASVAKKSPPKKPAKAMKASLKKASARKRNP